MRRLKNRLRAEIPEKLKVLKNSRINSRIRFRPFPVRKSYKNANNFCRFRKNVFFFGQKMKKVAKMNEFASRVKMKNLCQI